jgi:hypothetical protein
MRSKRTAVLAPPPPTSLAAGLYQVAGMMDFPRIPFHGHDKETDIRPLKYDFRQLCRHNHDGGIATRVNRRRILDGVADLFEEKGCGDLRAQNLKPKHIEMVADHWIAEGLSPGTIKNRMSQLRWVAQKIGKPNIVMRTNAAYGIPDRVYVTNVSKARELDRTQLDSVTDPYVVLSLQLQAAFGLRREESIKIVPARADRGDRLVLKDSWCKGGRPRQIPLRTMEQRQLVDQARVLAGGKSLVAAGYRTYRDYLNHFRYVCDRAGIHKVHGHRHLYAQTRYRELTGCVCPARGGPTARKLTATEKAIDRHARLVISRELGHGREQITATYLGR